MTPSPPGSGETLAAPATPPGEGGIHVILLAGPRAGAILDRLFQGRRTPREAARTGPALLYGRLAEEDELLDEVLLACRPPLFEINTHGGPAPALRVLEALERAGARPVAWQEFLSVHELIPGLDRLSREGLGALPFARTSLHIRLLTDLVLGAATRAVRLALEAAENWRKEPSGRGGKVLLEKLHPFLRMGPLARAFSRPPRILLTGPPNAGKSSLFNALAGQERVLVHPEPGTTRDLVEETVVLGGLPVRLCDTAGITEQPVDGVDALGVKRVLDRMKGADLLLRLDDGSTPQRETKENPHPDSPPLLAVASKTDLEGARGRGLPVSARTREGLDLLSREILVRLGLAPLADDPGPLPHPLSFLEDLEDLAGRILTGGTGPSAGAVGFETGLEEALGDLEKWVEISA